jgi:hypothetical protein
MLVEHVDHMVNESTNLEYQGALTALGRVLLIIDGFFDGTGGGFSPKLESNHEVRAE